MCGKLINAPILKEHSPMSLTDTISGGIGAVILCDLRNAGLHVCVGL